MPILILRTRFMSKLLMRSLPLRFAHLSKRSNLIQSPTPKRAFSGWFGFGNGPDKTSDKLFVQKKLHGIYKKHVVPLEQQVNSLK